MADAKLRAWWSHRQGLDGSFAGMSAAEILARAGWARSVAGAGPYLTLFSRAGLRREEVDRAVADIAIHELPAARGCTFVLPACDYALGLHAGQPFAGDELKVARRLGVTDGEMAALRSAVAAALTGGAMNTDNLRKAVGDAARSLGPDGVKKGIATTLPVALGLMQSAGEIRRVPVNGRVDQQRYNYALWQPGPLADGGFSSEETFVELARHFFAWTGGATWAEFQSFSGLSAKAAHAAIAPLKLEAARESFGKDLFMLPGDRAAYEAFSVPDEPRYKLVASLDNICARAREASDREFMHHCIVDRGNFVGLWDFDTATNRIVWTSFIKPDAALREAVRETEEFVAGDLGDARSFSLDSPKSRVARLEALRKAVPA